MVSYYQHRPTTKLIQLVLPMNISMRNHIRYGFLHKLTCGFLWCKVPGESVIKNSYVVDLRTSRSPIASDTLVSRCTSCLALVARIDIRQVQFYWRELLRTWDSVCVRTSTPSLVEDAHPCSRRRFAWRRPHLQIHEGSGFRSFSLCIGSLLCLINRMDASAREKSLSQKVRATKLLVQPNNHIRTCF
ncbi:hypothetical protein BDQ12DRAFT_372765 [Crucibulum laeve]|uniref:Uncharacterized protein n=1 Tax=Crucibulum laeve TaxID=68775 RepID=A0A5C3LPT8_9AGAR|nr:hypothetical protein BDQ12DRAFT_372765 [Crucibulum laeve]